MLNRLSLYNCVGLDAAGWRILSSPCLNVTYLSLSMISVSPSDAKDMSIWTSLRHLELQACKSHDYLELLSLAPNLTRLSVDGQWTDAEVLSCVTSLLELEISLQHDRYLYVKLVWTVICCN